MTTPESRRMTIYCVEVNGTDNDNYPTSTQWGDDFWSSSAAAQEAADELNEAHLARLDAQHERDAAQRNREIAEFEALAAAGLRDLSGRPPKQIDNWHRAHAEKNPKYGVSERTLIIPAEINGG